MKEMEQVVKIATRLRLLTGVLSVLLLAVGGVGLFGIQLSNEALRSVYEERLARIGHLEVINASMLRARLAISNTLLDPTPDNVSQFYADLSSGLAAADKEWAAYKKHRPQADEAGLAEQFTAARAQFVAEGLVPAKAAMEAAEFFKARKVVTGPIQLLFEPVRAKGNELMQRQLDGAKSEYDAAQTRYASIRLASILAIVAGVTFAIWFGVRLQRGISGSLTHAIDAARAVAGGELAYPIRTEGKDEVGQLLQAFATMQGSLATVVSKVRENSQSVAIASSEIARGNQYLSERTELQASALQRTAGTMEQLGTMARTNADSSREANQLAQDASSVAAQGGEVVSQVVDTMKGISDSSRKITDIIGVIDGIAFQTNILALNAAVEAARAGEQGRGFAVVASEVRSLARRSADAAKEIKALIQGSVEQVEMGTKLVNEAGETMQGIVGSIRRVTTIVADITAASAEQSSGVVQVSESVAEMEIATQQSAALVEQSAAAAHSLQVQAQQLVQAVAVFKLEADAPAVG
jgi:methyl-accepting chemotaxis protein-1 (serine sensor receptor)